MRRIYIQDECEAYICDKAQGLGLSVGEVTVTAVWDEQQAIWAPYAVQIDAPYDGELAQYIEGELGVPQQRQDWRDDG